MVQCIIFDLSEVLISGLVGIEKDLALELDIPEKELLSCFAGNLLERLLLGSISEETYLARIVDREKWPVGIERLKAVIRRNFHREVEGAIDLLAVLSMCTDLVLLSDHALEWVTYIRSIHPFLELFRQTFFSYELGGLKTEAETFYRVLDSLRMPAEACLFVDDNPRNVSTARAVGIPSVCFVDAGHLAADLIRRRVLIGAQDRDRVSYLEEAL
jgi:FMN phosphatase YigB (HAD superfamily)